MTEPGFENVYAITRPDRKLLTQYLLRALLTGPAFPFVFVPSFFKYETLKYRFDDEGITMGWGLLWRREIYLTYARIQDIHLSRGVIERWLGLATINIQTAAGSSSSEMSIVGLTVFENVRDYLYLRMRGARFGDDADNGDDGEPATPGTGLDTGDDTATALLTEIRDELRAVREQLKTREP
jgi:putative membrane protein